MRSRAGFGATRSESTRDAVWKLPKSIENPEGLVLIDDEEPWVASDTSDEENLFEMDRIDR